ncbi:unnamed protein product [Urochloa humidicola]
MAARRVVLFPFPSATHTAAMLHLAALLRARGLAVTVFHADLNFPDPAARRHPELAFVSIHETPLPGGIAAVSPDSDDDPVRQAMALNDACEAPFQAALAAELARAGGEVACAVVDTHWHKMPGAAARAGVPAVAFCAAAGAGAFLAALAAPRLLAGGHLGRLDEAVPGLEPLRARDLIGGGGAGGEEEEVAALRFAAGAARANASAVVLDTFDAIEAAELAKIRRELSGRPAFAVGPLHLLAPPPPQQPAADGGGGCLAWLDARPPRSVLYVSLGRRRAAAVDRAAFVEMAWGLAGSGVPFLWVLPRGGAPPAFPEEIEETVRRRGKVVERAPQREVLAHPAVGGFWTSCGWSSTMEAVCAGVPMLVHPCSGGGGVGQAAAVAARYVTRRWGTGMEIAGRVVERTAVARTIRRLMATELGPHAPRERARFLEMLARQCVAEGGPASLAVDELVEYMLGL